MPTLSGPRRAALPVLGLLVVTLLVAGGAPAGAARARTSFTVPADGTFLVDGHGFGHGHGMSQYGARGAARKGLSATQILDFYYPGTRLDRFSGKIAVLISADTTRDVKVLAQPGLTVRDRGTGKVHRLPDLARVTRWRLGVSHRRTTLSFYRHGWHRYKLAGHPYLVGDGEFAAPSKRLTLLTPSGRTVLRGKLRAASPSRGSSTRDTVNVLSIDNYVRGVVAAEMPASWEPAAVQAQAVAARSYALFERAANLHRHYQICDTTACQVYRGVAAEHPLADRAVRATAGRYLTYAGRPAFTQFSSSNGGWTSAGSMPYLPHQADPYDTAAVDPHHDWTVTVRARVLEKRYRQIGTLTSLTLTDVETNGSRGGWVDRIQVTGTDGSVSISGDDFRYLYGLRSTWFDFRS